jgi:hypothetical protein
MVRIVQPHTEHRHRVCHEVSSWNWYCSAWSTSFAITLHRLCDTALSRVCVHVEVFGWVPSVLTKRSSVVDREHNHPRIVCAPETADVARDAALALAFVKLHCVLC